MQFLSSLFSDKTVVLIVIGLLVIFAALFYFLNRRMRSGVHGDGGFGSRGRQQRLGVVDAFDLDSQRQLVIIRPDNVEHLVMIGGPNDVLVESAIIRQAAVGAPNGQVREALAQPAPSAPMHEAPPLPLAARQNANLRPDFDPVPPLRPAVIPDNNAALAPSAPAAYAPPAAPAAYAPPRTPAPPAAPPPPPAAAAAPPATPARLPFPPRPASAPAAPPPPARPPMAEPRLQSAPSAPPTTSAPPVALQTPPSAPAPSIDAPAAQPAPRPAPAPRPFPTLKPAASGPLFPVRSPSSAPPPPLPAKPDAAPGARPEPRTNVLESFESLEEEMAKLLGRPSSGTR